MKKQTIKFIAFLVVCLMTLTVFAACVTKPPEGSKGSETSSSTSSSVNTTGPGYDPTEEEENYRPSPVNYNGYDYQMYAESNVLGSQLYACTDENPSTSSIIEYALYVREHLVRDRYGVNLKLTLNTFSHLSTMLNAGEDVCDIMFIGAENIMVLAQSGLCVNLFDLDQLNLEASYYDQRIQKEYAIQDKLFTLQGDFTIADDFKTYVMVYNHTLYNNLGYNELYGTPYELASEQKWTFETLNLMIANQQQKLNGDGKLNEFDRWGLVAEHVAPYYFFLGSGYQTITNNSGMLRLEIEDKTYYSILSDLALQTLSLATNPAVCMPDRDGDFTVTGDWTAASNIFFQDRALFRSTALSAVTRLREMASNYGILPIPALSEEQDGYYCWVAHTTATLAIPSTAKNVDKTAEITEILAYVSRYGNDSLYDAFYDLLAYAKLSRTADDVSMLKLIFANKTYVLDDAAKITGFQAKMSDLTKKRDLTTFTSELDSIEKSSKSLLQNFVLKIISKN